MLLGLVFIISGLLLIIGLEQIYPDQNLPKVTGWISRVLLINFLQLMIVIVGSYTWENWFINSNSIFNLKDHLSPIAGGVLAYFINTWIFYWFHRARHDIYLLWVLLHQVHHSPQRIEVITSFYKHPLEIMVDSILMTILLFPVLGLQKEASIWLSIPSAYGEFFYHMNIKTPHWIGYFFQRPESHRIHHIRNKIENCKNYSDFPLWDILGNTFHNPIPHDAPNVATGFNNGKELKLSEMLMFQDVLNVSYKGDKAHKVDTRDKRDNKTKYKKTRNLGINCTNILSLLLFCLGLLQPLGYLTNRPDIRGLGVITTASPLPLVFSAYNGVETYSTSFQIELSKNNMSYTLDINKDFYSLIKGPYNRRNVFGVLFSHGLFFEHPDLLRLRDKLLQYAICRDGLNIQEHLPNYTGIEHAIIKVFSKITNQTWYLQVNC